MKAGAELEAGVLRKRPEVEVGVGLLTWYELYESLNEYLFDKVGFVTERHVKNQLWQDAEGVRR